MKNSDTKTISSEVWEKYRKLTTVAFAIQDVLLGVEYSITFLTLWLYLKELVEVENPELMYGLKSASYLLFATVASLFMGRLVDRCRNVRYTFFVINALVSVGNIIYSLPFSTVLLIVGRLIAGIAGSLTPLINGELARCYEYHELSKRISMMGMMYSIEFIMGPTINFSFKAVKIKIGAWVIDYTNKPTLFLAVVFALTQLVTYFMVYDISKQLDLKKNDTSSNNNREIQYEISEDDSKVFCNDFIISETFDKMTTGRRQNQQIISKKDEKNLPLIQKERTKKSAAFVLWSLLRTFDTTIIVITAWFVTYFYVCFEIWLILIVIDTLQWSITKRTAIVLATGVITSLTCLLFILVFYISYVY